MKTTLRGDVRAPRRARVFIDKHLRAQAMPSGVALDNVLLVADELVTNAVRAGATSIEVDLQRGARRLDIVVTDDAGGWPTPRHADDKDTNGRGLGIVAGLSDRWAVAGHEVGKSVTATWFDDGA